MKKSNRNAENNRNASGVAAADHTALNSSNTQSTITDNRAPASGLTLLQQSVSPNLFVPSAHNTLQRQKTPKQKAVEWLRAKGWASITEENIVSTALTSGTCHGLTFAQNDSKLEITSIKHLIREWELRKNPEVLVCLNGDEVEHSAFPYKGSWAQTLPGGPIFKTDRATIEGIYGANECFEIPSQIEELMARSAIADEHERYDTTFTRVSTAYYNADQAIKSGKYKSLVEHQVKAIQERSLKIQNTMQRNDPGEDLQQLLNWEYQLSQIIAQLPAAEQ